jgi:DNA-binding transcriptional LysR family regulator
MSHDLLDPVSLRAFAFAARAENFTEAARHAALTQSGVSKHVAQLEDALQTRLFERLGRRVRLTPQGRLLLEYADQLQEETLGLRARLKGESADLNGEVRYAMPESCLYTPHFEKLLVERAKRFPEVTLRVEIKASEDVCAGLLAGTYDFGFLTRSLPHRDLEARVFARENYVLVGPSDEKRSVAEFSDCLEANWIEYPGMDLLFELWQAARFPRQKRRVALPQMKISASTDHMRAALVLAAKASAWGVFPRHCVSEALAEGRLREISGSRCKEEHPIYLVRRHESPTTARVQAVLDAFWKMSPLA